jgi:putative copper resistance protein D
VPALATVEAIVLASVLFTAASLATQPPPVDTPGERATLAEVLEVFRPKLPTLRTPPMTTMIADASDPLAVVGGERTLAAYQWSNFSHNVAGLLLLAMSLGALAARARPGSPWRHWPAGFVALAVFVFLRSSANDGIWPFGPVGVWESVRVDAELLQHRLGALLAFLLGLLEWRARLAPRPRGAAAYVFPGLCLAGGILLLTHAHAAFEPKAYYLVQITHTTMGALVVLVGAARWLELRLGGTAGRAAGTASEVAMLAIALVLVFYREANVVVPPDTT